ncbi:MULTISPECIES: hypothetical protein [Bacteria][Archaea]|jgi:hypothetical protein|uniref:hypothetical protein n=1 Tax=Bacteria TaxID=2 RepID=UPI000B5A44E8|nr:MULTISPECIES: hypothetical protein [Bacteria]MDH6258720.1 hypothetical protein [Bradyrhizobium sp. BR13661]
MSIGEREARESIIPAPLLSENTLLMIAAAGFVILHVLTAVRLLPPSVTTIAAPSLEQMLAHYD